MNTIEEIIKAKITSESRYVEEICKECNNKNNDKDLCNISRRTDNTVSCVNYSRCMQNKCNTCKNNSKCWNGVTAKHTDPVMKGMI